LRSASRSPARPSTTVTKTAGQIPAGFPQGSGTLISGSATNRATEAALAAYPGVIVDRVAELSNGEYNVHCISDSWPLHVFVNQDFKARRRRVAASCSPTASPRA
jgi:hypothetical protein